MKKIVTLILMLCMVLTLVACNKEETTTPESTIPETAIPETTTPEITIQSIYDSSYVPSLLEKYDSVCIQHFENGKIYLENYYSKDYTYTSYNFDDVFEAFATDNSYYMNYDNKDVKVIILTSDGLADMKSFFAEDIDKNHFTEAFLDDILVSVTEKDGQIVVVSASDEEEIASYEAEGWSVGEEKLVLDAKTLDVISGNSVYSNIETGEVYEAATLVTYNVEILEAMKKFIAYEQQTEDMRTVTIVSNPGADNEKTESVQVPNGLTVAVSSFTDSEEASYTLYADAECTQITDEEWDVNTDLTIYVKWDKE